MLEKRVILRLQYSIIQKHQKYCLLISKLCSIVDLQMIRLAISIMRQKTTPMPFKQIQIMLTHIIIKELVLIEREILMKLLNALLKLFPLNLIKLIFFIIEDLLLEKKDFLIGQLKTMKMQLELILSILKHIIIEHFVGINQGNMNNRKLIIKALLICNHQIYQHFIIQERLGRKWEVRSQNQL